MNAPRPELLDLATKLFCQFLRYEDRPRVTPGCDLSEHKEDFHYFGLGVAEDAIHLAKIFFVAWDDESAVKPLPPTEAITNAPPEAARGHSSQATASNDMHRAIDVLRSLALAHHRLGSREQGERT